jgi:signal transduction histidine kinase
MSIGECSLTAQSDEEENSDVYEQRLKEFREKDSGNDSLYVEFSELKNHFISVSDSVSILKLYQFLIRRHVINYNYREVITLYEEVKGVVKSKEAEWHSISILYLTGLALQNTGQYDRAVEFYLQSLALDRKYSYNSFEINSLNNIATAYMELADFGNALVYLLEGLEKAESLNDTINLPMLLCNIGIVSYSVGDTLESEGYFARSMEYNDSVNDMYCHGVLASIALNRKNYKKADSLYQINLEYAIEKELPKEECFTRLYIADIQIENNEFEKAYGNIQLSDSLVNKLGLSFESLNINLVKVNYYRKKNDVDNAKKIAEFGLEMSKDLGVLWAIRSFYSDLSGIAKDEKNAKNEYNYGIQEIAYGDSVATLNNQKSVSRLFGQMRISELKEEQELSERTALLNEKEKLRQVQLKVFSFIVISLMLLLLIWFMYKKFEYIQRLYKDLKAQKLEISEKKTEVLNQNKELKNNLIQLVNNKAKLKEGSEIRDKFFRIMGEDLEGPFQTILESSILINQEIGKESDDMLNALLSDLNKVARNGYFVLENLLYWSRLQTDNYSVYWKNLKLLPIYEIVCERLKIYIKQKKLNIECRISADLELEVDVAAIEIVMKNILSNAIKYSDYKGRIIVEFIMSEGKACIVFSDEGTGISPDHLGRIFDLGETKIQSGTYGEQGAGLGLYLSRLLVENFGGELKIYSQYGRGTQVYLFLTKSEEIV